MKLLKTVARFNANSDRANLNCNRNHDNANASLGITFPLGLIMKTYKNLYVKICSKENLIQAYQKARIGKSKNASIIEFEKNLDTNLNKLREELITLTYKPIELRRFVIRDPKTRVIHASAFCDRVVHHAIINIIGPIYGKIFIYDSYASRIGKGLIKLSKDLIYLKEKFPKMASK